MSRSKTPRYQVQKIWHSNVEVVGEFQKRKSAVKCAAFHEASNLSTIAFYQIVGKNGEIVESSTALWKRESNKQYQNYLNSTVAARGVW